MKTKVLVLCVVGAVLHQSFAMGTGRYVAQLNDIRYSVRPAYSRLTMSVDGPASYSLNEGQKCVSIIFPKTDIKRWYDGARLRFSSGLIDRVQVFRAGGDTAIVAATFKKEATFRVQQMDEGKGYYLFVTQDSSSSKSIVSRAMTPLVKRQNASAASDQQVIAPITNTPPTPVVRGEQPMSPGSTIPWGRVILAVTLAAMGTGVTLTILRQSGGGRQAVNSAKAPASVPPSPLALPVKQPLAVNDNPIDELESPEPTDEESSALMLARQYRRGQGELKLSFNLTGRQNERQWAQLIKTLKEAQVPQKHQVKMAKKLGIGRGEVELAAALHRTRPLQLKEEPA